MFEINYQIASSPSTKVPLLATRVPLTNCVLTQPNASYQMTPLIISSSVFLFSLFPGLIILLIFQVISFLPCKQLNLLNLSTSSNSHFRLYQEFFFFENFQFYTSAQISLAAQLFAFNPSLTNIVTLEPYQTTKKLWNIKVMVMKIVFGALGTISKVLFKRLEQSKIGGRVDTDQTTVMLRSVRTLRRVLDGWEDLLSLTLKWKTIS